MQYELRELQQRPGLLYLCYSRPGRSSSNERLDLCRDGEIVQSGTPVDIYDDRLTILLRLSLESLTSFG